ncbi:PilW family protein [Variovorax sp. KK3]|uniref:PilW family protein n=1 Tax=Variovorax sp. KK3 TaxID=1855728 RepID=UPI0015C2EB18|nr:PilW family protein [Variovorax sp. KK3]
MNFPRRLSLRRLHQRGMTLIELMVAITIGLLVTLAVTSAVIFSESQKRTTTSVNDMGQSGAYAAYVMDRAVRSAGSGFTQSWDLGIFGCKLSVARGGAAILPRTTAFPAPFASFLGGATGAADLRISPILIGEAQGLDGLSDVIAVMGGNGAAGAVPRAIRSSGATANILRLDNTISLAANDLALVSQVGTTDCLFEQVNTGFSDSANNETLPLGSTYYNAASGALQTMAAGGTSYLTPLGNATTNDVLFQLYGVGANQTLFSFDLLRGNGTDAAQAMVEGVVFMKALYGVVNTSTGAFDSWVKPSGSYAINTVMTTPLTARSIAAVRVALVLRTNLAEKPDENLKKVAPAAFTLFSGVTTKAGVSLSTDYNLSADQQNYRHRVVEFTVPLRNILLLPTT